jgi:hypothetical protein
LGTKEENKTAMWVLSLLNQPVQEKEQRDSVIKIGEKEIPFNANKEEEAKISLIEYSSEESNTLSENQDRLEFKVKLNTVPIEFKAEIYDIDIENGTKFYRKSIEGEEASQNTITIREGDREYIVSEECNARGGISPKGDELTIRIEGCKVKDKETEEEKDFSMELKLKAKAEEQDNNEVGIAESPKSKFFTTRGCGGGKNKILVFLCNGLYEVIDIPVRHAISKKCYIKHTKYKKSCPGPGKRLKEFYYIPVHDSVCGPGTAEDIFDPNYFIIIP